jgi:hypothetical protein|tara:strand:- start:12 stop:3161 length:3150 start_codon:yes stop_codon:yes gene_type:complete
MSFTLSSVNKQFNTETESFQQTFNLTHNGDSIFTKRFDGSSTSVVITSSDTIVIPNHFYVTGEELVYDATDGGAIGIQHGLNGVGAATTMPLSVFAIKKGENELQLATSKANAKSGAAIGITTIGIGQTHSFTAQKKLSKAIISIDNVIQSPLYTRVGAATTVVQVQNREVVVGDASFLKSYDLIQIDDEIMRIQVVDYNGISNNLLVDREWMGTIKSSHTPNTAVQLKLGDYNIVNDKITFADVPFGGNRETVGVSSENFNVTNNSFFALSEILPTGTKVKIRSLNPPVPLLANNDFFIIQNAPNNFSFAETKGEALVGIAITLTNAGIGTHQLILADIPVGSSFQGRTFIRSDYDGNLILDDISEDFTGIGKTFTLKTGGANTTGITSDFGAILINNIFQKPDTDYNFISSPSPGITSVKFTGNANQDFVSESYSLKDVNANNLPRKGIIVSVGNTQGYGYQNQQAGVATAVVSGFGTVTVSMAFTGSGYTNGPSTYQVYVRGGSPTTGAAGTFTVRAGHIENIFMNTPGVGYTFTDVPKIDFDDPVPYDDLKLVSGGTGIGASVSVTVGVGLSIISSTLNNTGYGYTVGEQLQIVGIPTDVGIGTTFRNATITIEETQNDEFAGWVFGKLQVLDNFSDQFNDKRRVFTITENNEPISIESDSGSLIDLDQVLLIFIDDVLQKPGESYTFNGGTQLEFKEAPRSGSSLQILFYRGTDSDIATLTALAQIKKGDGIQILSHPSNPSFLDQDKRIVTEVIARDTLQTNVYKGQGISAANGQTIRPIVWSKQQEDLIIDGEVISKSRDVFASRIFPTARVIRSIASNHTSVYTNGGSLAFKKTEEPDDTSFNIRIIDDEKNTGFGSTDFVLPMKDIEGVNCNGDEGHIVGVGVSAQAITFEFFIPNNSPLRQTQFGAQTKTGIGTGDYFVISRSNVGAVGGGVTALSQTRASTVGIGNSFIDGVYQVGHIETVTGIGETMRVIANVETNHQLNFTGLTSGVGAFYGEFSWAKFTTGAIGTSFTVNTDEGLTGLSTAPSIQRTNKLLLDYT